MKEPIRKITLKDGSVRYRLVVDVGEPGARRRQLTRTFDRRRDARDELARIRHEMASGVYVRPSPQTLAEYLDEYIPAATRDRRESTRVSYVNAFLPVRERIGAKPLQAVTRADIEALVTWMLTAGRRRGGPPGTGLGPRSVRLTLGRLTAALEMAVAEGKLVRNPAALVKPPAYRPAEREVWDRREVRAFLIAVSGDRLAAAWRLSLYGLRRGEVLGLRWSDIDMKAKTLTVSQSRVLVDGKTRIEDPKSRNGNRTLPLDDALVDALTTLRKLQMAESAAAGPAYQAELAELAWYEGGEYVVTDPLGIPVHPEWYSDEFARIRRRAGLRRITLHDSRHTTLTLMEHAGVPISIISKWAGHYDSSFTQRTYVHASDEDLKRGRQALARIHKIG